MTPDVLPDVVPGGGYALLMEFDREWAAHAEASAAGPYEVARGATPAAALLALEAALRERQPAPACAECGHDAAIHYDPICRDADSVPECAGTGPDGLGCHCVLTPTEVKS